MKYRGITIIRNTKCNTWYARPRINGKQVYISAKTQMDCYNKLKKLINKEQKQIKTQETTKKTYTFQEWYDKWLELYKIGKVKDETLRDYQSIYKHISTSIKNTLISNLTLENVIANLNSCKSDRQRQKLYDLYNMVIQKAEDNDLIKKNYVKLIDKPKHEKNHGIALTNQEQEEFIKICKQIENAEFMILALYQGLRRGEVLGITRENIDFENSTLTINKSYSSKNIFDTTKNKQSMRTMPLFKESIELLLKYKNLEPTERVFNITIKQHEKVIKEIKEKSGIPDIKVKDMRSTFMTRCDELGIPERVYQAWVGHKPGSIVTKTTYVKHNSDADTNYINIVNKSKFNSNSTQKK